MNITETWHLHEIGQKKNQEDYIWPVDGKPSPDENVFIVCDGVGGSENGEVASRFIADFVARSVKAFSAEQLSTVLINELLIDARAGLMEFASKNGLNEEMATTFSLLSLFPEKAFVAWCGDTRVYHVRAGKILFKTEDHSLVNALKKEGEITEEEARLHPQKNIILRAVKADGSPIDAEAHWIGDIQEGDFFLLCTDGVLENISDEDIQHLLSGTDRQKKDLTESFQELCYGRTRDNYSMYLVRLGVQIETKPPGARSPAKILLITSIVLIFIFLAVYIRGKAIRTEQLIQKDSTTRPVIQNVKHDSLPYLEIVSDETDSENVDTGVHDPIKAKNKLESDSSGTR